MADSSLIGSEVERSEFTVEAGKAREFAKAIHDPHPRYRELEAARAEGFDAIPAPLTFSVVAGHERSQAEAVKRLGLDISRVVVGEVGWVYHRPAVAGDRLRGTRLVQDVRKRPGSGGGEMTLIEMETVFMDQHEAPVVTLQETWIETAEA